MRCVSHITYCTLTNLKFLKPVTNNIWGHAVAQMVEALRYKPEGSGFDSRWCHRQFSLT